MERPRLDLESVYRQREELPPDDAADEAIAEVMCGWDDVSNGTARELVRRIRSLEATTKRLKRRERERAAAIARSQPFFPDTNEGKRQAWVREQIALRIEEDDFDADST